MPAPARRGRSVRSNSLCVRRLRRCVIGQEALRRVQNDLDLDADRAGLARVGVSGPILKADGSQYAYNYLKRLPTLFVREGK